MTHKTEIKDIIPKFSLPRFNSQRRKWLNPTEFSIEENTDFCEVSFISTRGFGRRRFSKILPNTITIDERFRLALVAFLCEGTKPSRGAFTESSGNKGKQISFSNSDYWLVKLVMDEFTKIGINKEDWNIRLVIGNNQNDELEVTWWSKKLNIDKKWIKIKRVELRKKTFFFSHGNMIIEINSIVIAAILENLLNMIRENKL